MITVDDFRKVFAGRQHGIQEARGQYAVVVPVAQIEGEAHILYELRSERIDRQPGEVCFPGGEIEPGETPLQAALRETWEETGIPESEIDVIAELDTFHPPSNIVIYPFLAEISAGGIAGIRHNEREVAETFLVPVSFLEQEPYTYPYSVQPALGEDFDYSRIGLRERRYNWRPMKGRILSWEYKGRYIWGLTAQITRWTLDILRGERR